MFLLIFWSLVVQNSSQSSVLDITSYFFIATGVKDLIMFDARDWGKFLRKSVKSGNLNNYLIKPVKILPYTFSTVLGQNLLNLSLASLYICIGIFLKPPQSFYSVLFFGFYLINAFAISMAINLFEGALSLIFTEAGGITNSINHVSRVFSGALIPLSFFPEQIRYIVQLSPFPALVYGPANNLGLSSISGNDIVVLWSGTFWAVVLNTAVIYFWFKSLKKYEAVGI